MYNETASELFVIKHVTLDNISTGAVVDRSQIIFPLEKAKDLLGIDATDGVLMVFNDPVLGNPFTQQQPTAPFLITPQSVGIITSSTILDLEVMVIEKTSVSPYPVGMPCSSNGVLQSRPLSPGHINAILFSNFLKEYESSVSPQQVSNTGWS